MKIPSTGTALDVITRPANPPSARAPALWRVNAAIRWAFLLALQGVWWWFAPDALAGLRLPVLVASGLFASLDLLLAPAMRYRVHRWSVADDVLVARGGWLISDTKVVPIARMQTVTVTSGPTDRIFALATVTVTTASSAGPVRVVAVERTVAETMAAELTALAGLDAPESSGDRGE